MNHSALVRRGQAGAELARDLESLVAREPADPPEQRREVFPLDELHRQEVLAVGLPDVVDAAHVRVGDLPRRLDLVQEA